MKFDKNFFIKQSFTSDELVKYKMAAKRDLDITQSSNEPEVIFHFAYMALIKMGIYCIAKAGYRIKSRPGHHQKIIEYLSKLLHSEDIYVIGDKMRKDRNLDFYSADYIGSTAEINEYVKFVTDIYARI